MSSSNKKKRHRFFALAYLFLVCSLVSVLISCVSMGMQRYQKKHPAKLLSKQNAMCLFLLKLPSFKQKKYLIFGIMLGIASGISLAIAQDLNQKPKNPK